MRGQGVPIGTSIGASRSRFQPLSLSPADGNVYPATIVQNKHRKEQLIHAATIGTTGGIIPEDDTLKVARVHPVQRLSFTSLGSGGVGTSEFPHVEEKNTPTTNSAPIRAGPSFTRQAPWMTACSDMFVPHWCWPLGQEDTSLTVPAHLLPASCDMRAVSYVRLWNIRALLTSPRPVAGPLPWLLVRLYSRGLADGLWASDDILAEVDDPTGRMSALLDTAVFDRFGVLEPGCVMLLHRVPMFSAPGCPKRLLITTDMVHRVYAPHNR